jgi:hypothetical protein
MAPDGAVLCDVTAAARWGLPLPAWIGLAADVQIGIAVASGSGRPQRTGVRGRRLRLPSEHLTSRDGLFLTVPARTWVDCAEHLPVEHLVAMGDAILRRGLAAPSDLDAMVRWARGRRGVSSARRALPILDQGAESPGESWVRAVLVLAGLPRPQCNVDVYAESTWLARADLVWRSSRLIVEYDGIVHLREEQRRRDALRRNLLQDRGWTVIVFTAADLRRPERMVSLVRSALLGRANVGRVVGYRGGIAG